MRREPRWRVSNVPLPEPYLFGIAIGYGLQRALPWTLPRHRSLRCLVGWPLLAVGTYLAAWASVAAGRLDLEDPEQLLTSGPYAMSRNPMYVGWALVHVGAGIATDSGWVVASVVPAAGWNHRQVLREETALADRFGDEFRRYQVNVPRYLPRTFVGRR